MQTQKSLNNLSQDECAAKGGAEYVESLQNKIYEFRFKQLQAAQNMHPALYDFVYNLR